MANALVAEQGIINRQHGAAGIAEHEFDPLPDQTFDQNIRAAALFTHDSVLLLQIPLPPAEGETHKKSTRHGSSHAGSPLQL